VEQQQQSGWGGSSGGSGYQSHQHHHSGYMGNAVMHGGDGRRERYGKVHGGADSSDSWRSGSKSWHDSAPSWRSQQHSHSHSHPQRGWKNNDTWKSHHHHSHHHHSHQYHQQHQQHQHQHQHDGGSSLGWSSQDTGVNMAADDMKNMSLGQPTHFGAGGGRYGGIPFGPSMATYRYPTEVLAKIYRHMLYTGRLGLPASLVRDDPMLFTNMGEFVDVVEQLQGVARRPPNAYIDLSHSMELPSSVSAPLSVTSVEEVSLPAQNVILPAAEDNIVCNDTYMYVDPQGQWQGPFGKTEMLEWHAAGFFPLDLVMKSTLDTSGRLGTLQEWLVIWSEGALMQPVAPPPPPVVAVAAPEVFVQQDIEQQEPFVAQGVYMGEIDTVVGDESPLAPHNTEAEVEVQVEDTNSLENELSHMTPERVRPETKPAPWISSQASEQAISLRDIQQEEDARRAEAEREEVQRVMSTGKSGWASIARVTDSVSLTDIQQEEMINSSKRENDAFWDYDDGVQQAAPVRLAADTYKPVGGGWAAAAAAAASPVAVKQQPPAMMSRAVAPPSAVPPPPPPAKARQELQDPVAVPNAPALSLSDIPLVGESHPLTGEFREWCMEQMQALTGSSDVTLCEFLMTVESNSEVADYVAAYLGATPAVATFSSEFLKRKLAEMAAGTGKKSRKARAKARARAAAAAAESNPAAAPVAEVDDSSWETVETSKRKTKADMRSEKSSSLSNYSSGFAVLGR